VDPLALGRFAPEQALSPSATALFADVVLGGWPLLTVLLAALFAFLAWSRAKKLGAEVWPRRGLRSGPMLLPGTAQPLAVDPYEEVGLDPNRPFVEVDIDQVSKAFRAKQGTQLRWSEYARSTKDRPFALVTESGDRVRVEPSGKVQLIDRLERAERIDATHRRKRAQIVPGEPVWVRGFLSDAQKPSDTSPYRGGAKVERWVLRPPVDGPMLVSSQPVEAEGLSDARFHLVCAGLFLSCLLLFQGLGFRDYRALRSGGVPTQAEITGTRRWTTHSKNATRQHYAFELKYETSVGWLETEQETNYGAYISVHKGEKVPLVYDADRPSVAQIGVPADMAANMFVAIIGTIAMVFLSLLYPLISKGRRPWWRKRLIEIEPVT